jgi:hypothetical protein
MMYSPEVMSRARAMGDYLRYHSAIGNTLSELVILITARAWTQGYEWSAHQPIALKAGISKDIVDAIAEGRRPTAMSADEEIAYDFTMELQNNRSVSDATFAKAEKRSAGRASSIWRASAATTRSSPCSSTWRATPSRPTRRPCRASRTDRRKRVRGCP